MDLNINPHFKNKGEIIMKKSLIREILAQKNSGASTLTSDLISQFLDQAQENETSPNYFWAYLMVAYALNCISKDDMRKTGNEYESLFTIH